MTWIAVAAAFALAFSAFGQTPAPARKKSAPARTTTPAKPKPAATAPAVDPRAVPLAEVKITGNRNYKSEAIIAASGLRIGQLMKESDFEPARERLMATGGFETIGYRYAPSADGKGYSLTFEVLEIERTLPVKFEDLPGTEAELRKAIADKEPLFGGEQAPGHQAVLDRMAGELGAYLQASKGYKEPVAARVSADVPGELYVLFRPAKGRMRIAQIAFEGNQLLDSGFLGNAFGIVAVGVEFKEDHVRKLLDTAVRPHYEARGYLGVQFPKLTVAPMKDVEGVALTVQVIEGKPYKYADLRAAGTGLSSKETLSIAGLKAGDVANFDTVKEVANKLVARMQRDGYMRSKASFERKVNDAALTVDIVFKTEPGPQYLFGKLDIKGLDLHGEPAVRKIWGLKAGRPFNIEYPQRFLDEVKAQGMFDGLKQTRFENKIDDKNLTVDVTLFFR
jgi:outer membrane protein assembly factor BamA